MVLLDIQGDLFGLFLEFLRCFGRRKWLRTETRIHDQSRQQRDECKDKLFHMQNEKVLGIKTGFRTGTLLFLGHTQTPYIPN